MSDVFRKELALGILLVFITISIPSALHANPSSYPTSTQSGNWLYVGGSESGNYTTIQSAINAANPGDTVFVYSGPTMNILHCINTHNST